MKWIKSRHIFINENKVNITIPKVVHDLHKEFKNNGFKLYLVGGSVRDFLVGDKPKDFDLASDATYEEMQEFLSKYRLNHQGKSHGVIAIFPPI